VNGAWPLGVKRRVRCRCKRLVTLQCREIAAQECECGHTHEAAVFSGACLRCEHVMELYLTLPEDGDDE
jgi:hypothetical protein